MIRSKATLHLVLGLAALRMVIVDAFCGKCSSVTGAACLNDTAFAICFDGSTVSSTQAVCPEGQVCTEQPGICKPKGAYPTTCESCNQCVGLYSCRSKTEFEFCSNSKLTGVVVKCPEGEYCNFKNAITSLIICAKSCLVYPSCFAEPSSPTYKDLCLGTQDTAIHENIYDPTCKTYVYCENLNNEISSILYTCASGYYNASSKKCTADKPARCA